MARITLNRAEFRNKMYGCWLGKNIGGTLGGPFECRQEILDVTGYTTPAGEPMPNDDLDLQLIWLRAVMRHGAKAITAKLLGEYWLNYIPPYWNEYGICKANMRAGLLPPLSGEYRNAKWKHSNGAWIRSEIWACLAPGAPHLAIRYAHADASVDHGGGEGTYAAMWTAAVESAAFIMSDRNALIDLGLAAIPPTSRVARSIGIVRAAHAAGTPWQDARNAVVADSKDLGWFQAPANVAFVVLGWLYGEGDFGRSLCLAVNCGDDTDCTGATLGSILGILVGATGIPKSWTEPLGDRILTIAIDRGSLWRQLPSTLTELTDMVLAQTPAALLAWEAEVAITDGPTDLAQLPQLDLKKEWLLRDLWSRSPYMVEFDFVHTLVQVDYQRDPELVLGRPFAMKITCLNIMPDCKHVELHWHLPPGLRVLPHAHQRLALFHHPPQDAVNVELVADAFNDATIRATLEIRVPGRPTVGFIPLVFFPA